MTKKLLLGIVNIYTLLSIPVLYISAQNPFPKSNNEFKVEEIFKSAEGKYGVRTGTGSILIPAVYDSIIRLPDNSRIGIYRIKKGDGWGYVDIKGKEIVPPKFENVKSWRLTVFKEDMVPVLASGKWGFYNRSGNAITALLYDEVHPFSKGMAAVKRNGKWGYINTRGKEIVKPVYQEASDFSNGLAAIMLNNKWGCIDTTGKVVIQPKYDLLSDSKESFMFGSAGFSGNYAIVSLGNKWGMVSKTGKEVIPIIYDDIGSEIQFDNQYVNWTSVKLNGKWGCVDMEGHIRLPIRFDSLDPKGFQEGMLAVNSAGKWGYVDTTGREVIAPQFEMAQRFFNGKAKVKKGNVEFYIDKKGNNILSAD